MKKHIICAVILFFICSTAFAIDFAPTVLKISAPNYVQYNFTGSTLEIPVTITGTPATTIFCVFTKDLDAGMPTIKNGYLGWHTVNKVDTSIYIAPAVLLQKGNSTIKWNGKNQDGNTVPSGDYTYYLWSFDSVTSKYSGCSILNYNTWGGNFIDYDPTNGQPLARPIYYTNPNFIAGPEGKTTRGKWVLGGDPNDATLLETTFYTALSEITKLVPSPYAKDKFWVENADVDNKIAKIWYYQWVPNGESILQTDWGNDGNYSYPVPGADGWDISLNETAYVGNDMLAATRGSHYGNDTISELILINATDGSTINKLDLSDWWVRLSDGEAGGQKSGGPNRTDVAPGGFLFLGSHSSCMNMCVNPSREDWLVWVNENGDYVGDHNFEANSSKPWVCHDYNVGPYKYNIQADKNMFSSFPSFDMGAVSFGLYAPDGTGIDYFAYSGENAGGKNGTSYVHSGSSYDGMYSDNASAGGAWDGPQGLWFVGQDSFKGVISKQVKVESVPAAFCVAQNSPNPFNPTTTISFTLAKAGKTTVEVYNVAGQKIDTLVNSSLSAGSHSVTWNAAKFSAGVYFYTVKSGDFSKTMKMTLLK